MQRLLLMTLVLSFTACTQKKWDKDTMVNDCLGDFTKKNEKEKRFTTMQIAYLCDCVAEKMLVKYKSAKEADKDEQGMKEIGSSCGTEVLSK
jgi:hypothetical protein